MQWSVQVAQCCRTPSLCRPSIFWRPLPTLHLAVCRAHRSGSLELQSFAHYMILLETILTIQLACPLFPCSKVHQGSLKRSLRGLFPRYSWTWGPCSSTERPNRTYLTRWGACVAPPTTNESLLFATNEVNDENDYLLAAKSCFISLLGFELLDVLVEGDFTLCDGFESFDADVAGGDTVGIFPAPGGSDSRILEGFLEDLDGIFFRKWIKLRNWPYQMAFALHRGIIYRGRV